MGDPPARRSAPCDAAPAASGEATSSPDRSVVPGAPADHDRALRAAGDRAYWRANLRLLAILLSIWAFVSFGCGIVLVEPLNRVRLGGFPLGFWIAQQGSIYVFLVLIFVYAFQMDRIEARRRSVSRRERGSPQ